MSEQEHLYLPPESPESPDSEYEHNIDLYNIELPYNNSEYYSTTIIYPVVEVHRSLLTQDNRNFSCYFVRVKNSDYAYFNIICP